LLERHGQTISPPKSKNITRSAKINMHTNARSCWQGAL